MRYQMKQKVWAMTDTFVVKNESGEEAFHVKQKMFSIGNKLAFTDAGDNVLAAIHQKVLSWGPTYEIERDGELTATVKKKLMSFRDRFDIELASGGSLAVTGSLTDHEYTIERDGSTIATVSMKWFAWSDTYGIDIADGEDVVLVLAICVVIDMVCHPDTE
jgi:uncharacterized protein YxjI